MDSLDHLSVQNVQFIVILLNGLVLSQDQVLLPCKATNFSLCLVHQVLGKHTCFLIMSCTPHIVFCIPLRNCISEMLVLKPSFGGYGGVDSKLKIVFINSEKYERSLFVVIFSFSEFQNVI